MKYPFDEISAWAMAIVLLVCVWNEQVSHACLFTVWLCYFLLKMHITKLAKCKQIGGDKCTITVEADTTQARAELASLQKQVDELAAAVRNAKGE